MNTLSQIQERMTRGSGTYPDKTLNRKLAKIIPKIDEVLVAQEV